MSITKIGITASINPAFSTGANRTIKKRPGIKKITDAKLVKAIPLRILKASDSFFMKINL